MSDERLPPIDAEVPMPSVKPPSDQSISEALDWWVARDDPEGYLAIAHRLDELRAERNELVVLLRDVLDTSNALQYSTTGRFTSDSYRAWKDARDRAKEHLFQSGS